MAGQGRKPKDGSKRSAGGAASGDAAPFLRVAADWKGYVNVEQSDATKAQFAAFWNDADLVRETTAELLLHGFKVSAVQVDDDETVRATAMAGFRGMPGAGLAVSAWADSFGEAVAAVVFIVAIQAQFDLSPWDTSSNKVKRRTF